MKNPLTSVRKRLARLRPFPVLGDLDGATFLLDPRNWIDNRILAQAPYEREQLRFVRDRVERGRLDCVIDIGANLGVYTVLLGCMETVREVHAFEPVKRNFNQLCGNIFANRLDRKVVAHNLALADADGEAEIHVARHSTGLSRFDLTGVDRDLTEFTDTETVRLTRGDAMLAQRDRAVFMKIDVEGHTLPVLHGLKAFLSANHGLIQFETDPNEDACRRLLETWGWRALREIGGDRYFEKEGARAP